MKLILAEKPSVAKTIATVLGATTKQDGFFIGNNYVVSWCIGHLISPANTEDYDEKYKKWKVDYLPIIPNPWKYTVADDKKDQVRILKELMNDDMITEIINACDAGREGELIFRLVYEYNKCKLPIKRLWISSLEEKAIIDGFKNLKDGDSYKNLYDAALCRQNADWIVGINATRLFSANYGTLLNVGRVLSATLAMITLRQEHIFNFKIKPLYSVELKHGNFTALHQIGRTSDKNIVEDIFNNCKNKLSNIADIQNSKIKTEKPPELYDLTSLQRDANKTYNYTAKQTLDIAQRLYEKKLITYPRTDSKYLTEDMEHTLEDLAKSTGINHDFIFTKQVINNNKVTDHHAIIPTLSQSSVTDDEFKILDLIKTRLIVAMSAKHEYYETTIMVSSNEEIFLAKGKTVVNNGFKDFYEKQDKNEPSRLPDFKIGQTLDDSIISIKEGKTTPPKYYTEDTLLSAMETAGVENMQSDVERKGLGTPATRADTIEKLVKIGYIERNKKNLIATSKGVNIIKILPKQLKSPTTTAEWENNLKEVERGNISKDSFMNDTISLISSIIENHNKADPTFVELFPRTKGEVMGKCPKCNASVVENSKAYSCVNTMDKKCNFTLWKENKFFINARKHLTKNVAMTLLKDGKVYIKDLYSPKKNKNYSATVALDLSDDKWVNFKLIF